MDEDRLVKNEEAAKCLGLSPKTLQNQRCRGIAPVPAVRIRGAIRYRMSEIQAFIRGETSAPGHADFVAKPRRGPGRPRKTRESQGGGK